MNKTIQNFREPAVVGFEDVTASVVAIEPTPLNVVAAKSHPTQLGMVKINMVISMSQSDFRIFRKQQLFIEN